MKKLLFIAAFLTATMITYAQSWKFYRHELQAGIGGTMFLGELGGSDGAGVNGIPSVKDLNLTASRYVLTLGYRYKINHYFAARASFYAARVDGYDSKTNEVFRNNRNLSFKSPIYELSGIFEFYPFKEHVGHPYRMSGTRGKKIKSLSPYFFGGVGGFFFNPKGKYNGSWEKLAPYQTEGVAYKRISLAIPYGVGLKYSLNKQWSIGFEFGQRKTFTDYIDDVSTTYIGETAAANFATANGLDPNAAMHFSDPSLMLAEAGWDGVKINAGQQRGDSSDKDSYMFAIFSVHYRLLKGRLNLPKF